MLLNFFVPSRPRNTGIQKSTNKYPAPYALSWCTSTNHVVDCSPRKTSGAEFYHQTFTMSKMRMVQKCPYATTAWHPMPFHGICLHNTTVHPVTSVKRLLMSSLHMLDAQNVNCSTTQNVVEIRRNAYIAPPLILPPKAQQRGAVR